jgi:hypothetical protein
LSWRQNEFKADNSRALILISYKKIIYFSNLPESIR